MQRHLGFVAVAVILVGCPRYSQQPPPRGAMDPAGESAAVTLTSTTNAKPERPRSDSGRDAGNRNPTCLAGVISTVGTAVIPIARARVTVGQGDTHRETLTDDNGRFTWCAPRILEGMTVHASVRVEKAAFNAIVRDLDITVGTTTELELGLSPTQ